jgi:hypothetical protein
MYRLYQKQRLEQLQPIDRTSAGHCRDYSIPCDSDYNLVLLQDECEWKCTLVYCECPVTNLFVHKQTDSRNETFRVNAK